MLQIALAGLYTTLLCWIWGHATICLLQTAMPGAKKTLLPFSIVCLAGLSALVVIACALSIRMPLGGWGLQLVLLLLALLYLRLNKTAWPDVRAAIRKARSDFSPLLLTLFFTSILLLLVLGAWEVVHPDTLAYHAQAIRWIGQYKAVPGLVHLHMRYGLQNDWFIAAALFSFPFTHTHALTFVNTCAAAWYLLFVVCRIGEAWQHNNRKAWLRSLLYLLLLAYSFWDFGMLRLTAVSASPDFVAGLFCWTAFYLLANDDDEDRWILVFFFSIMAVLIKLSSAPILLLAAYALYFFIKKRQQKAVAYLIVFTLLAVVPYIIRNIITTGYLVFPLPLADIIQVDWKYDHHSTRQVQQYISDYARIGAEASLGGAALDAKQWLPIWWHNRGYAERFAAGAVVLTLLPGVVLFKRVVLQVSFHTRLLLLVAATGLLFWFWQAPDPRFGYGFLFPLPGLVLYRLGLGYPLVEKASKWLLIGGLAIFATIIAAYTGYRFLHFFHAKNWLQPEGIPPIATKTFIQQGILFQVPCHVCGCGSTPLPCAYDDEPFLLRGPSLQDGFKTARPLRSDR